MASASRHVAKIKPEWQAFQKANPDLRGLRLATGTASNGCILIIGHVMTEEDYNKAFQFVEATDPSRPIQRMAGVLSDPILFNECYPLTQ